MNPLLTPPAESPLSSTRSRFCDITHNPCGTDTWAFDSECPCASCQAYLDDLAGEQNQRVADELRRRARGALR